MKYLFYILFLFTSVLLSISIDNITLDRLLNNTIFNTLSVLVGLSIAITGIFLSSVNSIYLSIYKILKSNTNEVFTSDEIEIIKTSLSEVVTELKDNSLYSIYFFITALSCFFLKVINIPYLKWFIESELLTKEFFLNVVIIFCVKLTFWAIIDSVKSVFEITKSFELIKETE